MGAALLSPPPGRPVGVVEGSRAPVCNPVTLKYIPQVYQVSGYVTPLFLQFSERDLQRWVQDTVELGNTGHLSGSGGTFGVHRGCCRKEQQTGAVTMAC